MYNALDYKWANTLFGGVALILLPIPFVCFRSFFDWFSSVTVISRSFSFMDQLLENEVNFHALLWAYKALMDKIFDNFISLVLILTTDIPHCTFAVYINCRQ